MPLLNPDILKQEEETDVLVASDLYQLVVFNDDFNTFEDVIQWLVEICDHAPIQAEQCAILIHYTGKCSVKSGEYDDLKPRASALLDRGLSVEIQ
ncbi:MAG: ATP-dependent Clp protease adaptor ClpS [Bacteroidia bacterium]|nr:ATP-dependent Clp protease adaptor ClpS [Bacteroidia bacterium]MCC6768392.1 ATP-dependent Clp protease adaptor ClpS [Bacteroidia bacterium]